MTDFLVDDHDSDTVDYVADRERVRALIRAVERRDERIRQLERKLERARGWAAYLFNLLQDES